MQAVILSQEQFDDINQKLENILSKISLEQEPEKAWISNKEAMQLLNVGQTTLWTYRHQGLIKASKINKKLYFSRADILNLLTSRKP